MAPGQNLGQEKTMAKKKSQRAPTLCTFCGKHASPVTWDDPFPKTLWTGASKDRPLKVASCGPCNNRSNESILKHFFVVLDSRFHAPTLRHFNKPGGQGGFPHVRQDVGGSRRTILPVRERRSDSEI